MSKEILRVTLKKQICDSHFTTNSIKKYVRQQLHHAFCSLVTNEFHSRSYLSTEYQQNESSYLLGTFFNYEINVERRKAKGKCFEKFLEEASKILLKINNWEEHDPEYFLSIEITNE